MGKSKFRPAHAIIAIVVGLMLTSLLAHFFEGWRQAGAPGLVLYYAVAMVLSFAAYLAVNWAESKAVAGKQRAG
jgi:hypothetical protein